MTTTISTAALDPAALETNLSTMGTMFRTIQGHMSGPDGISSLIHDLKSYFVIFEVGPKITFIASIFDKLKTGTDSMSTTFESLNAAISNIDVLTTSPVNFGLKLNQYKDIVTTLITHFTSNLYGLERLEQANYNANPFYFTACSKIII